MPFTFSARRVLMILLLLLIPGAREGLAQSSGMSISVYTDLDQTSDFENMYVHATVIDNSWGCYHGGYMTTTYIYSPSNRVVSSQSSGLSSTSTIPIDEEYGEYTAYTSG